VNDLLVLWDLDGTLLNSGGVGGDLYSTVFVQLFGRTLESFAVAPMAGRTDRAIILETLTAAGVSEPRRYVDPFIVGMTAQAAAVRQAMQTRGQALPGAAAALTALASEQSMAMLSLPKASGIGSALGSAGGSAGGFGRRVHQSVLTGNIRSMAEVKLAALGLRDGLDLCIGAYGDDHEDRAELVHVARRRAAAVHGRALDAFSGPSTVIIGDTPLDVQAALATGARAVGVATGQYSAGELALAGAHVVLPDLTDTTAVMQALLS
jgi:phosphoglycolate phosphatase-like HAD superfamily hydrolase